MMEIAKINEELTALIHSRMPFTAELGIEVLEATPDRVVTRANWAAERCTTGRMLHGGYLMAVADSAGGRCAALNLPPGAGTATIESKTNFFRGVTEGFVEAVTTPVHVGRTTIVVQTDIVNSAGKLVSRTLQTQAVILQK